LIGDRSAVMPKTAGVSSSASRQTETAQFVSIALFSGVGLLVSLIIVLLRMNGI
jgi:hypothetical protein